MTKDIIFGLHPVLEAISSGTEIDKILIQKNLLTDASKELTLTARKHNIPIQRVPVEKLNRVTKKIHQGVICSISPISFSSVDQIISDAFARGKEPLILVLDRITDVRNFGAIVRTSECLGVDGILVPEKGSAAINADAMKTSAGALNYLPICRSADLGQSLKFLRDSGLRLIGMTEKTDHLIYDANLKGPLALILGSEEDGISSDFLRICDDLVAIPIKGRISSFNVSVSAAIGISETYRQRVS